ncbi:galactose-3-O-sulfotransferase 2 [Xenopus tropicalis]|nr:galactose-3-O-sulfotransferase 2 [Xenopus tropicalis]
MNILFRFGDLRNLSFAHPTNGNSQFSYPSYFSSRFVDAFYQGNCSMFHIMCQHMRFQLTEVEKVMPRDTFYFTILRNPVSQMESSFSYYKSIGVFSKAKSLEDFLHNASRYYEIKGLSRSYAKNLMTFDLGLNPDGILSTKQFQLNWRTVETVFDLVLITDYFDESLVLLKDALCWTLEDVASFPLNTRTNSTKKNLSEETQDMIKSWNALDWQLYIYFNHSFWNRVEIYGRKRMQREVEELRKLRANISMTCLEGEVDPANLQDKSLKPYQSGIARILGYNLKPGLGPADKLLCQRMVTPELQYTHLLVQKQKQSKYYCVEKKEPVTKNL